jgi:hypothetical protein
VVAKRPAIPADLDKQVRLEAQLQCVVCRSYGPTEIHHIIPWTICKEHKLENLILLCPNCHTHAQGGHIDRVSLRSYKALARGTDSELTFIRFNPNQEDLEILNAGNILALTECGVLDFEITFGREFPDSNYVYRQAGNGTVTSHVVDQTPGKIHIVFDAPCADLVDLHFF